MYIQNILTFMRLHLSTFTNHKKYFVKLNNLGWEDILKVIFGDIVPLVILYLLRIFIFHYP